MSDLSKTVSDILRESIQKYDFSLPMPEVQKFDVQMPEYDPPEYEDTFFKKQADDIANQINEKSLRQIEALESMADSLQKRVDVAEKDLSLYRRELRQAQHDTSISRGIAIISLIVSALAIILPRIL